MQSLASLTLGVSHEQQQQQQQCEQQFVVVVFLGSMRVLNVSVGRRRQ